MLEDQTIDRTTHRQRCRVDGVGYRFQRQAHAACPIAGEMRRYVQQKRALEPGKSFGSANVG